MTLDPAFLFAVSSEGDLLAKYKRINFYFDPDSGTDQVEALDEDA